MRFVSKRRHTDCKCVRRFCQSLKRAEKYDTVNTEIRIYGDMLMRNCMRCGSEMKEGCAIKIEGAGYGIVMASDEGKLFGGRIGKPKVAICPKCGEVSIYVEAVEKLK